MKQRQRDYRISAVSPKKGISLDFLQQILFTRFSGTLNGNITIARTLGILINIRIIRTTTYTKEYILVEFSSLARLVWELLIYEVATTRSSDFQQYPRKNILASIPSSKSFSPRIQAR